MREAILQYYQQSGDSQVVIEVIKQSQEDKEMTDGSSDTACRVFGKRRYRIIHLKCIKGRNYRDFISYFRLITVYVTLSDKTGLIAHNRKSNF